MPSAVAMAERTVSHRLDLQNPMVLLHIKYYLDTNIFQYINIIIYLYIDMYICDYYFHNMYT